MFCESGSHLSCTFVKGQLAGESTCPPRLILTEVGRSPCVCVLRVGGHIEHWSLESSGALLLEVVHWSIPLAIFNLRSSGHSRHRTYLPSHGVEGLFDSIVTMASFFLERLAIFRQYPVVYVLSNEEPPGSDAGGPTFRMLTNADEFKRAVAVRTSSSRNTAGPTLVYWVEPPRLAESPGQNSPEEIIRGIVPDTLVQGKQGDRPLNVLVCSYYSYPKEYTPPPVTLSEPGACDGVFGSG